MNLDFDRLLEDIGEFGLYQKIIYFLLCLPAMVTACATLSSVFTAAIPLHRCFVPGCDFEKNSTYDGESFLAFTIPDDVKSGKLLSSCSMYQRITTTEGSCFPSDFYSNRTTDCHEHWVYDDSVYKTTLVMDFALNCDEEWKVPLTESIFFAGTLVGSIGSGQLADTFGRKKVFYYLTLGMVFTGIAMALVTDFTLYLILLFLCALFQVGCFQTCFILAVEFVGKSKRVFCGIVIEYFFVLGECILALSAWYLRRWRQILLSFMIPSLIFVFYWPVIPESVRWLISKDRVGEADKVARRIAKWNKSEIIPQLSDYIVNDEDSRRPREKASFFKYLRSRVLSLRLLNLCYGWLVVAMVYYGLSLNAASLAGSVYLNFVFLALVEIPGYTASYIAMEKLGRRPATAVSMMIAGLACLLSGFLSTDLGKTIAFLVGKMGITCAFGTIYLYTSELLPTSLRTVGLGTCSMSGRIGAILSPYIALSSSWAPWMPLVIFGGNALVSGFFLGFLPETLGRELPETVRDAEHFTDRPATTFLVVHDDHEDDTETNPLIEEEDD